MSDCPLVRLATNLKLLKTFEQTGQVAIRIADWPYFFEALAFLKRHFYQYERYHAVRSKEMMEARVDAVFDSLRKDSDFIALTRHADGRLMMPMLGQPATQASPNR